VTRLMAPFRRLSRWTAAVLAVVVVAALGFTGYALASGGSTSGTHHITAYFTKTIGLYEGNDVRILGVKVGTIDSITPDGDKVKVEMTVDGQYPVPADVKAVIIPPSVVSDRYVQLTPPFTGGEQLPVNATLGLDRTQVPLEFDEIFRNLDQLNQALGPKGANANGALQRLVDVSAKNLAGNGTRLNEALKAFSGAISTLSGSRGNLFATVRHLQQFTTTLAQNDGGVRALNANLAKVGNQLAGERAELGAALSSLSTSLRLVNSFVAQNHDALTGGIHKLTDVTNTLMKEKEALKEVVDMAPFALTNLALAGDPKAHTLDTKDDAGEPLANPTAKDGFLCQLLPPTCTSSHVGVTNPLAQLLGASP
jgi:phospholipid/cholesterol/gamma-HCH transport system substrate-binding protein